MLALVAVATVAGLAAAFLQLSTSVARRQVQMRDRMRAFYVAEAALSEAWTAVQLRKTGAVGSEAEPAKFGDGLFWVEATDTGPFIRLESTAMVASGTATLAIVVQKGKTSMANLGVHSGGNLDLPPGTLLDAYDSRLGYGDEGAQSGASDEDLDLLLEQFKEQVEEPIGEQPLLGGSALFNPVLPAPRGVPPLEEPIGGAPETPAEPTEPEFAGRIGSGGDISVTGTELLPTTVNGDITPGTSGSLTQSENVTITGATDPSAVTVDLPDIEVPSLPALEGVAHTGASPLLVLPVEASLPTLSIGRGAKVIVEGPATLVLENLSMAPNASLFLDTSGGPVSIYVTNEAVFSPTARLSNLSEDPTDLNLQISAEPENPITIPAGVPIYGMIYAPGAELNIPEGFELFGSLAAAQITFNGPPQLHFDQYLDEYASDLAKPLLLSWRIVELINESKGAGNPFVRLGVDPAVLKSPANAHIAQPITIDYVNKSGFAATFTGNEDAFDWSDVRSVDELARDGEVVVQNGESLAIASDLGVVDELSKKIEGLKFNPDDVLALVLARSPVTREVLRKVLILDPPMPSDSIAQIFAANAPAPQKILNHLCTTPTVRSDHLSSILLLNSPGLSNAVLSAAQARLTPAQFTALLALQ